MNATQSICPPRVGQVPLQAEGEQLHGATLRQRACTELLRQAAIGAGLLATDDPPPQQGAISEAAAQAIEALLAQELLLPEPDEQACRRHHAAHPARFAQGERAELRHVLFAVTPGVDLVRLRQRAEACLIDLRARNAGEGDRFPAVAAELSNCPSGGQGGALGWLRAEECAPEFAREIFGRDGAGEIGVLPRLVHSRFGLHVVEVLAREAGVSPPFEAVRPAVVQALRQQAFATALRQYLSLLAARIAVQGVDLEAATSPLLQ